MIDTATLALGSTGTGALLGGVLRELRHRADVELEGKD